MIRAGARACKAGALAMALVAAPLVQAQTPGAAPKTWRQAMIAPKADAGFFLMAARRGFAEREGLKLEVIDVKDDQVGIRALLSGEVDSFDSATGGIAATGRGADAKMVGCPWLAVPYVVLARAGIGTMEGLKGKTIAASAPGTPPDLVARASLAAFKVPEREVKFTAVGGDRDRYNALIGGLVDAAVVADEYTPLPASKSLNVLVEAKQVLPKWIRFCTVMSGKALGSRRADAVAFLTAQIRAFRYAVSHREETIRLTREATDAPADDPRPGYVFDQAVKPGVVAADFPLPMESLAWMRDTLAQSGRIPNTDVAKMVDPDLRTQALDRIGK